MRVFTFTILFLFGFIHFNLNAQTGCPGCAINTSCTGTAPTLCPSTLPDGQQGQTYDTDLTFFLPETFVDQGSGTTVTLQQILITGVSGMPQGLSWQANNTNNTYVVTSDPLTQRGCVKICGTPTIPGSFTVTVSVIATVNTVIGVQNVNQSFNLPLNILAASGGNPYFSFNPSSGCGSANVTYQALINIGTPQVTEYVWDFGNGSSGNVQNPPAVLYDTVGTYVTTLDTKVFNHVFNSITALSNGSWWCGDVEEVNLPLIGCTGNPDMYFKLTHGGTTFQSAFVLDNTSASWSNLGIVLSNMSIALSVWDDDNVSQDDDGGTYTFLIPGPGTYNYTTNSPFGGGVSGQFVVDKVLDTIYSALDTVHVYTLPTGVPITVDPANVVCQGTPITLSVYGGYSYQWFQNDTVIIPGAVDSFYVVPDNGNYPQTGSYRVQIIDPATGCSVITPSASVTINEGIPPFFATNGISYSNGTLNTTYSNVTYQWLNNGVPISPNGTNQTYKPTSNGSYSLIITNSSGCSDTSNIINVANVSLETISNLDNLVKIFPNPSDGSFNLDIQIQLSGDAEISILNMVGEKVHIESVQNLNGTLNKHINASGLASGMYILDIHTTVGNIKKRLIIK